jgi:predicted transcriptional regulator
MCGNSGEKKMNYTGNQMFSAWLYRQLDKSEITQDELITMTGISETSIFRWFEGRHLPKLANLIVLCEVFAKCQGRSPRQLVFEALMNVAEMAHAEARWKKQNGTV